MISPEMGASFQQQVVFLDRDGVLIENRQEYVRCWADVAIFPQAVEACHLLSEAGFAIVVVTNQAVVGRGILTYETVRDLNERIIDAFRSAGANILASYICHHHPDEQCDCRKPRPGMLLQAAREHDIDLTKAFLVGDALTDIQAAEAGGVKGILVRTGRGISQEPLVTHTYGSRFVVCDDLLAAATLILASIGVQG